MLIVMGFGRCVLHHVCVRKVVSCKFCFGYTPLQILILKIDGLSSSHHIVLKRFPKLKQLSFSAYLTPYLIPFATKWSRRNF